MGYTPVFQEIYTGSLYGRWPAAPVWASLLPLADRNGRIDMSLQAIAGMTGWPVDLLERGIQQLMEPDPESRTPDEDGRRLVPLDPARPWGWRLVNHRRYREKARLQQRETDRVASGENKARMQGRKEADPRRPPQTPADPPSDKDIDIDREKKKRLDLSVLPADLDEKLWKDFVAGRAAMRAPVNTQTIVDRLAAALEKCRSAGFDPNEALGTAVERGWKSVKPEWLKRERDEKPRRARESTEDFARRMAGYGQGT